MFKKKPSSHDPSPVIKTAPFNFSQIERYFALVKKDNTLQTISDRTYQDLDLEDVFKFIDRTSGNVGQQYLYNMLRTIPAGNYRSERIENLIKIFDQNPPVKQAILSELSGLHNKDAYYIYALFLQKYIEKPGWFWIVQVLSLASICSVFLSFVFPQFLIFLLLLLAVNFGFHYWNKNNLHQYGSSIPQLMRMNGVAKKILEFRLFDTGNGSLSTSIKMFDSLGRSMSLFKLEANLQSELGLFVEYLMELIKALFLIEPILLFRTLKILDSKRSNIQEVFDFVGEIDAALSIQALRKDLPHACIPSISANHRYLGARGMYHPLIFNAVPNDIIVDQKSVLLTGSNMSGKSTFIRSIGINVILGQAINTCFATEFVMPEMKVHSCIRVSDDLLNEKSYYFEEVLAVKNLLDESHTGPGNLFLLDELFKGTNTVERIAAGKSVLSYLNKGSNLVFVSTHDLELADHLSETFDLYHFSEIIEEHDILFDYKLKRGNLVTTNAIRILELNGYPPEVIADAIYTSSTLKNRNDRHQS